MKQYSIVAIAASLFVGLYIFAPSQQTYAWWTQIGFVILWTWSTWSGSTTTWSTTTWSTSTGSTSTWTNNNGWGWSNVWPGSIAPTPTPPVITNPIPPVPTETTWSVVPTTWLSGQELPEVELPSAPIKLIDQEVLDAYERAKKYGITTIPTRDKARLDQPLLRAELAKMMSNFVINVMGKTLVDNPTCAAENFADSGDMNAEEKKYVRMVCSLGIMWWKNDKSSIIQYFKPNNTVTRAEFGTVLSRFLYWDTHNWDVSENGWYTKHLMALKLNAIMKKIDQPMINEIRWYVMIMMKRVYEK